jgi:hypothetical protein
MHRLASMMVCQKENKKLGVVIYKKLVTSLLGDEKLSTLVLRNMDFLKLKLDLFEDFSQKLIGTYSFIEFTPNFMNVLYVMYTVWKLQLE